MDKSDHCAEKKALTLGLALGSGAIRGLAHIGVMRVFDSYGIKPDIVVGASAGALVGALYSIGQDLNLVESFFETVDWKQLTDFGIKSKGLIRGNKVLALLKIFTKNLTFADCRYRFAVTATDLDTGERVLIREGYLANALRASISIPGIFCPMEFGGRCLVDGGLTARVPVAAARELGADIVVGVDVSSSLSGQTKPSNIFEVILQSIDIMEEEVMKKVTAGADLMITPSFGRLGPLELSRTREVVRWGEEAAHNALPRIMELLGGSHEDKAR